MTDVSSEVSIQKEEALTDFEEDMLPDEYDQAEKNEQDSQQSDSGLLYSLKLILSAKNYGVYLITSWIFGSIVYLQAYLNLYLRALGWDFIVMGAVLSVLAVFASVMRLIGGHVGDITNRKNLSVVAMLPISVFYFIIGVFVDPLMIVIGLIVYQSHEIARSGSSAYILENTPKKHSGLAMSLFNAGKVFGIVTLVIFGASVTILGFTESFRLIFLVASFILFLCAVARAKYLEYDGQASNDFQDKWSLKRFLQENKRAAKLLLASVPGLLTIVIIDGISDSFFKFGALIYANEVLAIDISGINMILLVYSVLSVPLLFKLGRVSDKSGIRRAALIVYLLMPVSAALLILAPIITFWAPQAWILNANSTYPGLGAIFSTAFIAIVMKYLNDTLWYMVLLTLIQKSLPKKDTAKILSIFWFTVYVTSSVGPLIAGAIFEYLSPAFLFGIMLVLNLIILISIQMGSFAENSASANGNQKDVVE
ncbi:MFS transporter [Candidatus Thorarchaeota archaeon]|nr:MAG: MFS transporter [Candidatus Thorarchaeota archaeon]